MLSLRLPSLNLVHHIGQHDRQDAERKSDSEIDPRPRQKDRPPEQTLFRRENAQQQNRESGDGKQRGRRKHPWMGVGIGSGLLWIGPGMDKEEKSVWIRQFGSRLLSISQFPGNGNTEK